ncbi:MAG: hypothetical protein HUU49_00840 [Candidatus Buchananbacteria bacterium]|nr:hypothetical protein [Candidatus Buchananbacteria bacterium]
MTSDRIAKRIYVSVVTFLGDWRQMISDVNKFKLKEISLFLTGIGYRERQELYQLLAQSTVRRIPHVHARHDMKESELDYLVKRYGVKAFTIHFQFLKHFKNSKHKKIFFVETNDGKHRIKSLAALKQVGGVCVDLSHVKQFEISGNPELEVAKQAIKKYKVGCNHLSAVLPNGKSKHTAAGISQLNYVTSLPKSYFSSYINIELANSIPQQLRFKKHLVMILTKQWNKKF